MERAGGDAGLKAPAPHSILLGAVGPLIARVRRGDRKGRAALKGRRYI
jgi:hypothetical protein